MSRCLICSSLFFLENSFSATPASTVYECFIFPDSLDSYEACSGKNTVNWIHKPDILIGKGKNQASGKDCQIIFGVQSSTETNPRLVLEIQSAYIHDCGVTLQINESRDIDFEITTTNKQIVRLFCKLYVVNF